jgi:hypothetical protein
MPCLDCLNDEKTLIAQPNCGSNCPEYVGCDDDLNANCVTVTPALPCIGTAANTPLTEVLQATDAKLCQSTSNLNACKVKVSANDECCDYLGNKISVTNGLVKTILRQENNCETVNIAHPTWNTVEITSFQNPFVSGQNNLIKAKASTYFTGTQRVHEVKLSGVITAPYTNPNINSGFVHIASLPNFIPPPNEDYYTSYVHTNNFGTVSYTILINGSNGLSIPGQIRVWATVLSGAGNFTPFISLNGINYLI